MGGREGVALGRREHVPAWRATPRDTTHDRISWAAAEAPNVRTSRDGRARSSIPSFPVTSLRVTLDTPPSMCLSCLPAEHRPTAPRHDHSLAGRRGPAFSRTPGAARRVGHDPLHRPYVPCPRRRGSSRQGGRRRHQVYFSTNPLACSRGPATARHLPRTRRQVS